MLKTFVINLAGSDERWASTSRRLSELKVPFERFEAVDGRVSPHPLFERHDDKRRQKYRGRALSGGELGCFASHFLLWQRCVELDEPIVVMEDDITIDDSYYEALNIAESNIDSLKYLRLAGTYLKRRPYKKIGELGSFDLIDHIKGPAGTLCYVISPKAAKIFVQHADVWFLAVDDYMDRYWHHHINCYSLMPFPIGIADGIETDMIRSKKASRSLKMKLVKAFYGLFESFRRIWYRNFSMEGVSIE
ncbi:MAG: glycosyl transferase family 25, partial [Oleiphilaceae bacterium]